MYIHYICGLHFGHYYSRKAHMHYTSDLTIFMINILFLDLSTSSEDEEEISQRQRLNAKNPMFPQLWIKIIYKSTYNFIRSSSEKRRSGVIQFIGKDSINFKIFQFSIFFLQDLWWDRDVILSRFGRQIHFVQIIKIGVLKTSLGRDTFRWIKYQHLIQKV